METPSGEKGFFLEILFSRRCAGAAAAAFMIVLVGHDDSSLLLSNPLRTMQAPPHPPKNQDKWSYARPDMHESLRVAALRRITRDFIQISCTAPYLYIPETASHPIFR